VNVWFPVLSICGFCGIIVIPKDGLTNAYPSLSKSPVQARIRVADNRQNNHAFHRLMGK